MQTKAGSDTLGRTRVRVPLRLYSRRVLH